jgi:deoxyribonuclease-4
MRIGAHVSAAGGLANTMTRAAEIGAECAQIFVGAPQRWFSAKYSEDDVAEYRRRAEASGVGPNVVHALYLVNLASPDEALRERSINALVNQMHWCEQLEIMGLIVHVGSAKGALSHADAIGLVTSGIEAILVRSESVAFLVENTAGMGTSIGSDFQDIGEIFRRLGRDTRLGVCLDTAHTFEAGYDIATHDGLETVLDQFDRAVGLDRIRAIHANDSKTRFGSNVDRHENIGRGFIGEDGLGNFMTHPAMCDLPFYLEVPGYTGRGPDRENIDALRRLAGLPLLPAAPPKPPDLLEADPPGLE